VSLSVPFWQVRAVVVDEREGTREGGRKGGEVSCIWNERRSDSLLPPLFVPLVIGAGIVLVGIVSIACVMARMTLFGRNQRF